MMKRNSRLSLALHTLSHMAQDTGRTQTSSDIANHAGNNPVIVRRILGKLRTAEPPTLERSHSGGCRLARASDDIALADVYLTLAEGVVASRSKPQQHSRQLERHLEGPVNKILNEVETTLIDRLSSTTTAEIGGDKPQQETPVVLYRTTLLRSLDATRQSDDRRLAA